MEFETYTELFDELKKFFPDAEIDWDDNGEVIIRTRVYVKPDHFDPEGEDETLYDAPFELKE